MTIRLGFGEHYTKLFGKHSTDMYSELKVKHVIKASILGTVRGYHYRLSTLTSLVYGCTSRCIQTHIGRSTKAHVHTCTPETSVAAGGSQGMLSLEKLLVQGSLDPPSRASNPAGFPIG